MILAILIGILILGWGMLAFMGWCLRNVREIHECNEQLFAENKRLKQMLRERNKKGI